MGGRAFQERFRLYCSVVKLLGVRSGSVEFECAASLVWRRVQQVVLGNGRWKAWSKRGLRLFLVRWVWVRTASCHTGGNLFQEPEDTPNTFARRHISHRKGDRRILLGPHKAVGGQLCCPSGVPSVRAVEVGCLLSTERLSVDLEKQLKLSFTVWACPQAAEVQDCLVRAFRA